MRPYALVYEPSATSVCGLKHWQAAGSLVYSALRSSCMRPSAPCGGDCEVLASRELLLRLDPGEPAGLAVSVSARAKPIGVALHSQLPENAVYKLSRP